MSLLRAREAVMLKFRPMLARHDVTEQFAVQLVEEIPDDPSGKFCAYRSLVKSDSD